MSLSVRASSDASNAVVKPALSQAVGYVVVVVIGLGIAIGQSSSLNIQETILNYISAMIFVTRLLKRTVGEDNKKTEMYDCHVHTCWSSTNRFLRFMTANRSVRTGLTASAVVSVR